MRIPKKELFIKTLLSFDVLFFFLFSTSFLIFIYVTDFEGNAKDIGSLAIMLGIMLLIGIIATYFNSLRILNKIIAIIQQEAFSITTFTMNPLKIELEKHQKQLVLTITSISLRATAIEVAPKKTGADAVWKKEIYTRFDSINKLKSILDFAQE